MDKSLLYEWIDYEPETGVFTWRKGRGLKGRTCGSVKADGYFVIKFRGKTYPAGRLAWFYMNGEWPPETIDHINRDPLDNRYCNLRPATRLQQTGNRRGRSNGSLGVKGVYQRRGRYFSFIPAGRGFDTPEEAQAAYLVKAREKFGEFASA